MKWIYAAAALLITAAIFGYKNMTRKQFAANLKIALGATSLKGMTPLVIGSTAALESGWGTGNVFQKTNNLFSIMGPWSGQSYKTADGRLFRIYPSLAASVADFVRLITSYPRYTATKNGALQGDIVAYAHAIAISGYVEGDPAYAKNTIENYNVLKGYFA